MSRISTLLTTGVLVLGGLGGQEVRKPEAESSLAFIVDSARKYCAKLERAALDFVCME
ncbi:MAG: hypothetical protein HGA24_04840, partial [Candidatus Aminicenantes bacterium]|nr:hypothetical protein [Candidatus Aminicenantes bacterium]